MDHARVLLITRGQDTLRRQLAEFFSGRETEVWDAEEPSQGWKLLRRNPVDLLVAAGDNGTNGTSLVAEVKKFDERIAVVAIVDSPERGRGALAQGAYDFFLQPVDFERLDAVLHHVAETAKLREQSQVLEQLVEGTAQLGSLVTRDPNMIRALTALQRLGRYTTPVLLEGEPGTGKESLARALHDLSGAERPFIALERDTSVQDLDAAWGRARGGTLFISDVLALRPETAARLLALLERGDGANGTAATRVIAAATGDVAARARQGAFRDDLYTRFAGSHVLLAPLRQRRGDLGVIASAILRERSVGGEGPLKISLAAEESLASHEWPGNVDELRRVLDVAAASAGGRVIERRDLPSSFAIPRERMADEEPDQRDSRLLRDIEIHHLRKVLAETRGNKARAARILGLSRWALQRKLQKHGIGIEELARGGGKELGG